MRIVIFVIISLVLVSLLIYNSPPMKGCAGYPAGQISGIRPDIRFHLTDIRLAG